jgi:hypothetical protein
VESWRIVWRKAAPLISTAGLEALAKALHDDDPRLIQGATTEPPPLYRVRGWPPEASCVFGFCGWQGDGAKDVAGVEEYFARLCFQTDEACGNPADCRWFINWADETSRAEMRASLLPEVTRELSRRRREPRFIEGVTDDGGVVKVGIVGP